MSQIANLCTGFPYKPAFPEFIGRQKIIFNRFSAKGEELIAVPYRNGDIFESKEEKEQVMVDTVRKIDDQLYLKLVSLDKTFNDEPIEYLVSETTFLEYYSNTSERHPFLADGNYSVSAGD